MRILIHGLHYAPDLIGIARYTGELATWLARRGHQVTVLTAHPFYPRWRIHPAYRGRGWCRERLEKVEVLRAPLYVPSRVTGKSRLLHELSFGASCLSWWPHLFKRRWDAVVAVCPLLLSGIFPALLARRQKIPFVFHIQDLQVDAARELDLLKNQTLFAFLDKLEKAVFLSANAVTTISEAMADRLRQKGVPPSRVHLIPNWADLEGVRPQAANNKLRPELGVGPEDLAVLYAGNLGAKQGLEIILECAHLTREDPHIKYVVAGEGAIRASLEEQARQLAFDGTVIFLPVQSNSRFPLLLAMGDIHLVLQKQQVADLVMPSKLTNIMAAGRPFIATATPDTELGQVTMASQAGVLIPPEDGARLAEVIRALSADVSARAAMGRRARQYAETYLAKDPILTRLEDLLLVHRKMLTPKESI